MVFPDTYYFAVASSDRALLRQAYSKIQSRLQALWEQRSADLPFKSAYEALIFASIVEKATGRRDDRNIVAAVFVNRLKRGRRLQPDPPIIYGLPQTFDGTSRRRDLLQRGPCNTYTRYGLPAPPL